MKLKSHAFVYRDEDRFLLFMSAPQMSQSCHQFLMLV